MRVVELVEDIQNCRVNFWRYIGWVDKYSICQLNRYLKSKRSIGALRETHNIIASSRSIQGVFGCFWIKVGQSVPCVKHEKSASSIGTVIVNITFIQSELSAGGVKWDIENKKRTCPNCILALRSSLQILRVRRQCCLVEDKVVSDFTEICFLFLSLFWESLSLSVNNLLKTLMFFWSLCFYTVCTADINLWWNLCSDGIWQGGNGP